jgi:3-phenylpropionate/trans-cinnamate dioxygenase ferredoxin subunit
MARFLPMGKTSQLKDGAMSKVSAGGREMLLAKVGNSYYVADNRCSHMGGDLSQGSLDGTIVTCPRHGSRFDLRDGRVVRWTDWSGLLLRLGKVLKPPKPIVTYRVKIEDDIILVEV